MLSSLNIVIKKSKDFADWKTIVSLIYKGKHMTDTGRELIIKISRGMNNNRLSTNCKFSKVEIPSQSLIECYRWKIYILKTKTGYVLML
jgi:hypothetical protein